jgi:type IV secretory pathway VirB10-like protein
MIVPEPNNLKNIPLLYPQYVEKALAKAKEYFTADVTVRPGRIVAVEGEWKEEEEVAEQPCSKEKMMSSLSELAGDPAKDMIRNIAEKIFSFGCSILDRVAPAPAPVPAAAAPPPLAAAEAAPVDASGIAVAVAADAHEIVVAEPAAAAAAPGEEEAAAKKKVEEEAAAKKEAEEEAAAKKAEEEAAAQKKTEEETAAKKAEEEAAAKKKAEEVRYICTVGEDPWCCILAPARLPQLIL